MIRELMLEHKYDDSAAFVQKAALFREFLCGSSVKANDALATTLNRCANRE